MRAWFMMLMPTRASDAAVVHALNCLQGAHYVGLGAKNFQHRLFMDGWMSRTHCNPAEAGR